MRPAEFAALCRDWQTMTWHSLHRGGSALSFFLITTESCHSTQEALHNWRKTTTQERKKQTRKKKQHLWASLGTRPSKEAVKVFPPQGETLVNVRKLEWLKGTFSQGENQWKALCALVRAAFSRRRLGTMQRTRPRKPLMEAGGGRRDPEKQKRQPAAAFTVAQKNKVFFFPPPDVTQH